MILLYCFYLFVAYNGLFVRCASLCFVRIIELYDYRRLQTFFRGQWPYFTRNFGRTTLSRNFFLKNRLLQYIDFYQILDFVKKIFYFFLIYIYYILWFSIFLCFMCVCMYGCRIFHVIKIVFNAIFIHFKRLLSIGWYNLSFKYRKCLRNAYFKFCIIVY